jgi:tetratricopeptide (TPR) repeat protein
VDGRAVVVGDDADIVRDGGEATRVIADFQQATSELLSPGDSQAHFDLGTTYLEMELFDEAAAEFQFAARDETLAVASQEMLGYVFLRQGRLDVAVGELQKGLALSRDGDHRQLGLLYNLGIAYGAMDRQQDAIASFSRILVVDSTFRDVRSRLERLLRAQ